MAKYDALKEIHGIARAIKTDSDAREFLNTIRIEEWLKKPEQRDFLSEEGSIKNKITFLSNHILEAENKNEEVFSTNTLVSDKHRSAPYKDEKSRKKLRKTIIKDCMEKTIIDDEHFRLGNGGLLPDKVPLKNDKMIFFIIGSPASGKSSIAKIFAEKYGAFMLDSDLIKRKIPEFSIPLYGASLVHKESNEILKEIFNTQISLGTNIVYQLVGAEYDEFIYDKEKRAFINKGFHEMVNKIAKEFHYDIVVVLPELDREIATRRALKRFIETKRYVPLPKILDDYSNNATRTFYKMHCFEPQYKYIVVDTNVPFKKKYKKIYCNESAKDIFKIL